MKRSARLLICLLLPLAMPGIPIGTAHAEARFPLPAEIEPDVRFWVRVYSEIDTGQGFLHDSRDLSVVYETLQLPERASKRTRDKVITRARTKYKKLLDQLARGKRKNLSAGEARVLALFPEGVDNKTLRDARRRIRFQLGQADKFRAGIIRSGAWERHIRETLRDMGLPQELAALPHVESSYTPHASSHVGAAGLWQFTRSTGRRYLRVDHVVDERLDPYRSTLAAARLLENNRQVTGAWPLAITAYNHGAGGMRRATRKLGTRDIATIARRYRSRTFGFASRNFYMEFLAALEVSKNSDRYFGPLQRDSEIVYETISLPYYAPASSLADALGIDRDTLRSHNPALLSSVWRGSKRIPKDFEIRVPRSQLSEPVANLVARIPSEHRYARQTRDTTHKVRRGETLSGIAARYGIRASEIQALNGLRSRNRIYAGQKLKLPEVAGSRGRSRPSPPRLAEPTAPPPDGIHVVSRGETVSRIASRYGMSEQEVLRHNKLRNRNRIYVGQKLYVAANPAADGKSPESGSPAHPQAVAALTPAGAETPTPASPAPAATALDPVAKAQASPPAPVRQLVADDAVGVMALDENQTPLLADPSDYSVASDGRVEVQPEETLGHYAEWLGIRASQLRRINGLKFNAALPVGRRVKLDFSHTTPEAFEQLRVAHHRDLQEAFFERYEITGTLEHRTRRGESLWTISEKKYRVPIWLIRQYNPDLDLSAFHAGDKLRIPKLKPKQLG